MVRRATLGRHLAVAARTKVFPRSHAWRSAAANCHSDPKTSATACSRPLCQLDFLCCRPLLRSLLMHSASGRPSCQEAPTPTSIEAASFAEVGAGGSAAPPSTACPAGLSIRARSASMGAEADLALGSARRYPSAFAKCPGVHKVTATWSPPPTHQPAAYPCGPTGHERTNPSASRGPGWAPRSAKWCPVSSSGWRTPAAPYASPLR